MKRPLLTRSLVTATAFALAVPLFSATPAFTADDRLVASYALDETSGTVAADSSGNGLDATYVGGPTLRATLASRWTA